MSISTVIPEISGSVPEVEERANDDVHEHFEARGAEPKRKRLQLELSDVALRRLNELVEDSGCGTLVQFARTALSFYAHVLEQQKEGYRLQFVKDAKQVEFLRL